MYSETVASVFLLYVYCHCILLWV